MKIHKTGSRPSSKAPEDYFSGRVRVDPIAVTEEPARVKAALVTFEPGARTHWHSHPVGQVLHITQGAGRVQTWEGPVVAVSAGDTVIFAPGEKHWHGAGVHTAMSHIAINEALDGETVSWMEAVEVSD